MTPDENITFEIVVATTGECFDVTDVPLNTTVKQVIKAFCKHRHLEANHEMTWRLAFGAQIIDNNTTLIEIFSKSESRKLQLFAKVSGA